MLSQDASATPPNLMRPSLTPIFSLSTSCLLGMSDPCKMTGTYKCEHQLSNSKIYANDASFVCCISLANSKSEIFVTTEIFVYAKVVAARLNLETTLYQQVLSEDLTLLLQWQLLHWNTAHGQMHGIGNQLYLSENKHGRRGTT